jgi:CHASE1-domain containing sensor protein
VSVGGLTERYAQGRQARAAERSEYFPAFYVQPATGSILAAMNDLGPDDTYRAALDRARDTGRPTATGRIDLPSDAGSQYGFGMIQPIYRGAATPVTVEERRHELTGFVTAAFRIGDIVQQAMAPCTPSNRNDTWRSEFSIQERQPGSVFCIEDATVIAQDGLRQDIRSERTVNVAGRSWLLVAIPSFPTITPDDERSVLVWRRDW